MRALSLALTLILASAQGRSDYEVYSASLDAAFADHMASDSGNAPRLIIRDSTEAKGLVTAGLKTEFMRRQFGWFSSAYESTLDDFIARNQSRVALKAREFTSRASVEIATRKDLSVSEDPEVYWREYFRKYPRAHALLALSRPGFDADRKYALVYYHVACGIMCGERGYVLMRFTLGRWMMVRRVITVMS